MVSIQTAPLKKGDIVAIMETNHGTITIKLFPQYTPKTFENFTTLAKNGYYNGTTFHRVIKNFMIQGGDPTGTGAGGESIYGQDFEDEFHPQLSHIRGALSMANAGPNTNGSQFFIVHALETHYLDGAHAVFGQVIDGFKVVDDIAHERCDRDDRPISEVSIQSILIQEYHE